MILICRNATAEDLQEQELATLKSHLTDAIHARTREIDRFRILRPRLANDQMHWLPSAAR